MNLIIYKMLQHKRRYIFMILSLVVIQTLVFLTIIFLKNEKKSLFPETLFNIENCYNLEVLYPNDKNTGVEFSTFQFDEESLDMVRSVNQVKYATVKSPHVWKHVGESMLTSSGKINNIFYTETGNGFEKILNLKLLKGSLFSRNATENTEAIITKTLADSLGILNKELPQAITVNGIDKENNQEITCTITGIVEDIAYKCSGKDVFPLFCRRNTLPNLEFSGSVLLKLDDHADLDELEKKIGNSIQSFTKTKPIVQLISLDMVVNEEWNEGKRMILTMLSIIPLVLFYAFFAIFGLFWSEMSRDKIKYGILRAIGFSRMQVFSLVFKEAVVLSFISFAFTSLITLNMRPMLQGSFDSDSMFAKLLILSFLVIFVFVVLAACIPAIKTTMIHPVEALSEE
jgi:ABC-type antimicrobial peptide transport system permease subunit